MKRRIHLQTNIQTVFGILDDGEENAAPQPPVTVQVDTLSAEMFEKAHAELYKQMNAPV